MFGTFDQALPVLTASLGVAQTHCRDLLFLDREGMLDPPKNDVCCLVVYAVTMVVVSCGWVCKAQHHRRRHLHVNPSGIWSKDWGVCYSHLEHLS